MHMEVIEIGHSKCAHAHTHTHTSPYTHAPSYPHLTTMRFQNLRTGPNDKVIRMNVFEIKRMHSKDNRGGVGWGGWGDGRSP